MESERSGFRILVATALALALVVVLLGAWVRLSDAGLGCPDWPGCYGQVLVPESTQLYPERPLQAGKAWKEMVHRYAAGTLGLLILVIAVASTRVTRLHPMRALAWTLVALVLFQALLGMWTVTLKLHPLVVMGHLLGGFALCALLAALLLRPAAPREVSPGLARAVGFTLALLVFQIALGGWTSANYAAPFCPDLPQCQGQWWPPMEFAAALRPELPPSARDFEGGTLSAQARTAIHVAHRLGAVVVLVATWALGWALWRQGLRRAAALLSGAALGQFLIGVANVWWQFPLALGVAHNGAALALLLAMTAIHGALVGRRSAEGVAALARVS